MRAPSASCKAAPRTTSHSGPAQRTARALESAQTPQTSQVAIDAGGQNRCDSVGRSSYGFANT
eukprot:4746801-Prymnesium_polylepis.1